MLFVLAQFVGNLKLFAVHWSVNAYARFLKDLGPFLGSFRGGLLAVFLLHLFLALQLKWKAAAARPTARRAVRVRARRGPRPEARVDRCRIAPACLCRRGGVCAADLPQLVLSLEGVTLSVARKRPKQREVRTRDDARLGGRASSSKEPAASYSPRGSTPKYHRRGRA